MSPSDQSHIPVERLARLLLQRAREDDFLLRRVPANDDGPPPAAFPPADAVRHGGRRAISATTAEALEELISVALLSAQEAQDLAREVSRRARRGVAVAVALGMAALAIALAGAIAPRLDDAGRRTAATAALTRPIPPRDTASIDSPTENALTAAGMYEASALLPGHAGRRAEPAAQSPQI